MKTSRTALQSVVTKLNALRVTLSNEEQEILDSIVLAASGDETEAHAMTPKATPRVTPRATPRVTPAATPDADEVEAHAMTPRATPRITPRATPRITLNPETGEYVERPNVL